MPLLISTVVMPPRAQNRETINSTWRVAVLQDHYDDERDKTVFGNTTPDLQDQDQDQFFWSQAGLVLRPTVSDHITAYWCH